MQWLTKRAVGHVPRIDLATVANLVAGVIDKVSAPV
jgi:hypothetical protein